MKSLLTDSSWVDIYNSFYLGINKTMKELDESLRTEIINASLIRWREVVLTEAKERYYSGNPMMTDQTYDKFEDALKLTCPDSPVLKQVGTKTKPHKAEIMEDLI